MCNVHSTLYNNVQRQQDCSNIDILSVILQSYSQVKTSVKLPLWVKIFGGLDGPNKFRWLRATRRTIFGTPQIAKNAQNWQFGGYQKWHFQWPGIDETCWDHPGHQKMTHIDNGPGPGRNYGETTVFTFCLKWENGPKIVFFLPKKHPKPPKRLIFIWEKGTFSFAQLCPVVARTWFRLRSVCFFLPQKFGFRPENPFFHMETCFFALQPG